VYRYPRHLIRLSLLTLSLLVSAGNVGAQKKSKKKTPAPKPASGQTSELAKLREQYVQATNEYKASLQKLVPLYEAAVKRAEDKLAVSQKLLAEGLIAKKQVEENELALAEAKKNVAETRRQLTSADDQIAAVLVETAADEQLAKNLNYAKQRLVRTSSFIRFTGGPGWNIGEAWKVQRFFSDTFRKELPIAVFGQGAIHNRWRLDHRNSMDVSRHPDSAEGQALLNFLQRNGIPYLAFRSAIPGTATGPHIHIGRPSHRY
jgi:ribosome-binding protein aMBF1 (putative translation factor)